MLKWWKWQPTSINKRSKFKSFKRNLSSKPKKEQAALVHAKLNKNSFVGATSFVSVTGGQSFVVPASAGQTLLDGPTKMQRNNSSDRLNAESGSGDKKVSPEKMGDIAGIENEFE